MSTPRPRRQNLADDVAAHLRDAILSGRLQSGARVDQDAIAEELGVSRLPVREALIALDQEGLIHTIPRRGAYVQVFQPEDIEDHYQIYGHVAGIAAARASQRMSVEEIEKLKTVNEKLGKTTSVDEQESLNFEFHKLINASGGSKKLRNMLGILTRSLPVHHNELVPGWPKLAQAHHQAIVDAIEARDAAAAQRAMEDHLAESAAMAIQTLRERNFFTPAPVTD